MIVVTGGAGFIGSNLIQALNEKGHTDILVVDDLKNGRKYVNLLGLKFLDYIDKKAFLAKLSSGDFGNKISAIFHQGACSATTEWDGQYLIENNYEYSKSLFHYSVQKAIPFLYASSAAVYGAHKHCIESPSNESPLNMYGYSKLLFDNYVRRYLPTLENQVVGFRYFNVYGPKEQHKGSMASVAYHLNQQFKQTGVVKLFEGCDGYADGEQRRDFVYVKDVADVNVWFWETQAHSGIYNIGTGQSAPFNAIARAVLAWHGEGELKYISFPEHLKGVYQSFTQANISALRKAGYDKPFKNVDQGVRAYIDILESKEALLSAL